MSAMTYKEVATMVNSIGVPFAYHHFPEGTGQAPPFVVFFYSQTDDQYADDENYQRIVTLNIELYTKEKDFTKEALVEQKISAAGLSYYKEENYIDSELMWQIAYEMEVVING